MEALKQKAWGGAAPHPPPALFLGPTHRVGELPPPKLITACFWGWGTTRGSGALIQEPLSRVPEFL